MICLDNLTVGNRTALLENQSLQIAPHTLTAIVGRNGSGKSTLLRVISGAQRPISGAVTIDGLDPVRAKPAELAKKVAVVTTETLKIRNVTCRQFVAIGRSPYTGFFGTLSPDDYAKVDEALGAVGMSAFAGSQISEISDGEMRRVMIARALAQDTAVILLDEPTSFLDVPGRYEISALLADLAHRHGKTIVYSTHELEPALLNADLVALLADKQLLALPPEEMRHNAQFQSLFGYR